MAVRRGKALCCETKSFGSGMLFVDPLCQDSSSVLCLRSSVLNACDGPCRSRKRYCLSLPELALHGFMTRGLFRDELTLSLPCFCSVLFVSWSLLAADAADETKRKSPTTRNGPKAVHAQDLPRAEVLPASGALHGEDGARRGALARGVHDLGRQGSRGHRRAPEDGEPSRGGGEERGVVPFSRADAASSGVYCLTTRSWCT